MRNGKIAKLPDDIRKELNERMENGEESPTLLEWLNALPEVQKTLKESFEGVPISKQNLCEWRQGGFAEWHMRNELMAHADKLSTTCLEMERDTDTSLLAGNLVTVLAAHYARLLNTWDGDPDPKFEAKLRILRGLAKDIALIQKTAHQADRQKSEFEQKERDDENRVKEEIKREITGPFWARLKSRRLATIFGGGEYGKKAGDLIAALEYDIENPDFNKEPPRTSLPSVTSKAASAKKKVSAKGSVPRRSEGGLVAPKPCEGGSNPVKPELDPSSPPPPDGPAKEC